MEAKLRKVKTLGELRETHTHRHQPSTAASLRSSGSAGLRGAGPE
jgi:hypothetical protein